MSIAASVVVQPSRLLAVLMALLCLAVCVLGAVFLAGVLPDISTFVRWLVILACFICAFFGAFHFWRHRRAYLLDISGTGQIRLRHAAPDRNVITLSENPAPEDGILVRLLPDSTIWPKLLVLRMQDSAGRGYGVVILPDSLPPEAFRAVSVACRWIVRHRFPE